MFCSQCGNQISAQDKFCKTCGTPVNAQAVIPVAQPAPATAPVAQAVPDPAPVAQPAPAVYQQPVQAAPQPVAPALAKEKAGPRRTCFVIGLITCILLILVNLPAFAIGGMMLIVGPFAMMLGASNTEDIFGMGLLVCFGAFLLIDVAIVSIVFNSISSKITAKRPASKCRSFRMAAAIMILADSLITVAPIIGLNYMMSDAEFFYAIYAVVFIMAVVFFVLAIITNNKEKKLASA